MVGLCIAGKTIRIDMPIEFLHDDFKDFIIEKEIEVWDFNWEIKYMNDYDIPDVYNMTGSGSKLRSLYTSTDGEAVVYKFYEENAIPDAIIASEYCKKAVFLLDERYRHPGFEDVERIKVCLFNTFREIFFLGIGYMGIYTIHSASVLVDNKAYLFSTFSGGGKTTHSNMWIEHLGASHLDGDVAVLNIKEDGRLYAYGLPWCGTSGLFTNKCARVEGIAFIEQEKYNEIEELEREEAGLSLFFNCFTPMITERLVDNMIGFVHKVVDKTKLYKLKCLPNVDAAKLSYSRMTGKRLE